MSSVAQGNAVRAADAISEHVETISAMANATRFTLLVEIVAAGDGICVCDLVRMVPVGQSAVSQALARLHEAGLVNRSKCGSWRYYEATDKAKVLMRALDQGLEEARFDG